jgi:hypothetical protein
MNCLCSTCRLTLIPGGLSANLPLPDYGRVARDPATIAEMTWRTKSAVSQLHVSVRDRRSVIARHP